jgi:leader peptidase (prepilin peptidase)/N-methyltransferase
VPSTLKGVDWGIEIPLLVVFAAGGAGAGWAACRLLRHGVRPAPVPAGWCVPAAAALWAFVAGRWSADAWPAWWLPLALVVTAFAVPLTAADLRHRRLPDVLTVPAYPAVALAVGWVAFAGPDPGTAVRAGLAALVFGAAHLLLHLAAPAALGAGDVKLAGSVGGILGAGSWPALLLAACLAALVTVVLAVSAALLRGPDWRDGVPHGPGMLLAAVLVVVFPGTGVASGG